MTEIAEVYWGIISLDSSIFSYEATSAWSMATRVMSYVARVKSRSEAERVIHYAREHGKTIVPRGTGYSYGDEILNLEGIVLDLSGMDQILDWDPESGLMRVEPGVRLEQVLARCLPDNWVVATVPGTRFPTVGGALSNNIHGKNAYLTGNFGDWVVSFTLLTAEGRIYRCTPNENKDLFYAAIGGMGMLGVFLEIEIQCKKIPSPFLHVQKWTVGNFDQLMGDLEPLHESSEYHIAWVDCFAKGKSMGRGTIHAAKFIDGGGLAKANGQSVNYISPYFLGIIPRTWIWPVLKPFFGNRLLALINTAKYYVDAATSSKGPAVQNYFEFSFLLDKIPNWRSLYSPLGYYELEPLIPLDTSREAIKELIEVGHEYNMPSYLCAIKRHKKDDFLISYSLDGYSIGIDVPLRKGNRELVDEYFHKMNEIVIQAGGITYLAKDEKLSARHFRQMYPRWGQFANIKDHYDPTGIFQSDMYRRLFLD